jgi:phosphatidylglycerophosphate synthase
MDDLPNDLRIQFYSSARAEVTQRIALRDQTLIAYVVAAGGYLGLTAPAQSTTTLTPQNILTEIALVAVPPIISLVFTFVILQHHVMIGIIGDYLRSLFPADNKIWEQFYIRAKDKGYLFARTASQALLLAIPVIYVFIFMARALPVVWGNEYLTRVVLAKLILDLIVLVVIIWQHIWAYVVRCRTDRVGDKTGAPPYPSQKRRRPMGRTLLGIAIFRSSLGALVLLLFRSHSFGLIWACILALILAEASDLADGAIARTFSTPTLAGYLQDSIADKIFNFGCLLALATEFRWIHYLIWGLLIREFLILATRIIDTKIDISLKRFKPHVVLYAVFVRTGIFGFLVTSLNTGRPAAFLEFLSYLALAAAAAWGAINIVQTIFFRVVPTDSLESPEVLLEK